MNILKYIGYVAFFLFAFVVSLYWTFPWNVAKARVLAEASKATGMAIEAKSLEPDWVTGFEAQKVSLRPAKFDEPIEIERVNARAHLLPLFTGGKGGTVSLPMAQGQVEADVVDSKSKTEVKANLQGLQLALVPGLKDTIGVPLSGKADLVVDLALDKAKPEASSGVLQLKGSGLELLKGGKVGGMTLPFELNIGDFDWRVPLEQGKAQLSKLKIEGGDVLVELDGTITMAKDPMRSVLNLTVKFKPADAFLKKEPLLGALLNNIRRAKGKDGFYGYAATGTLKHPRFFPKRGR